MIRLLATALAITSLSISPVAQQTPPTNVTAGVVSGTVITDEIPGVPVRRAVVSLADAGGAIRYSTLSDGEGRFEIPGVAAGRYGLSAWKGGYVTLQLGALTPNAPGMPLIVTTGRQITGISLVLMRGAVITGTVRDQRGAPARGLTVYATTRNTYVNGRSTPGADVVKQGTTDDTGTYRVFGLEPGDYLVWTPAPLYGDTAATQLTTAAGLERARQVIQAAPPGRSSGADRAAAATATVRTARFADTYYPSTSSSAAATLVRVTPGDIRSGIDITRLLVPTAQITGQVVNDAGSPATNVRVWIRTLVPIENRAQFNVRTAPDGTFVVPPVSPGEYILGAEGLSPAPDGSGPGPGVRPQRDLWSRLPISVSGVNQSGVVLRLQPGHRLSGRVVFDGSAAPSAGAMPIQLIEAGEYLINNAPTTTTRSDGSFVIDGIPSAAYRFRVLPPSHWVMRSISMRGRDVDFADVPLVVDDADLTDVTITFASQKTQFVGTLQDRAGRSATAYTLAIFTTDRNMWQPGSRRMALARADEVGQFAVDGLPPGEYFVAAVKDFAYWDWPAADLLSALASVSTKIGLREGTATTQSFQVGE